MPVQIDIKVDAKGVIQGLEIIGRLLPGVTQKVAEAELLSGVKEIKTYPTAKSPNYQRTGTYGKSTGLLVAPYQGGTKFTVYSEAMQAKRGRRYSSYVGGTTAGAPGAPQVTQYGWKNIYDVIVRQKIPKIIGNVDAAIQSLIAKSGFKHY